MALWRWALGHGPFGTTEYGAATEPRPMLGLFCVIGKPLQDGSVIFYIGLGLISLLLLLIISIRSHM